MRILVTGGAGFIGSNLVDVLMARGDTVSVIDNLSTGKLENVAHHLESDRFHFVEGSILDAEALASVMRGAEAVYHLAAVVGVKHVVDDPLQTIITNVQGTESVLRLAHETGARAVVASSSEVYGKSTAVPLAEEDDRLLGPTSVKRWCYAAAKALDEYVALAYAERGLPVAAVRYFNAYGPRLDPQGYGSVIARFIGQAMAGEPLTIYGSGEQTRCFTFVADTVRGTMKACTMETAVGKVFNIGANNETTINDLARRIRDLTGSRSEITHVPYRTVYGANFEETQRRVPDLTRSRRTLNFSAQVALEEGLRQTIAWFERR